MRYWLRGKLFSFLQNLSGRYCLLLVSIISLDRLIMVNKPIWSKIHITPNTSVKVVTFTLFLYVLYHVHFLYGLDGVRVMKNGTLSFLEAEFNVIENYVNSDYFYFYHKIHNMYVVPVHDVIMCCVILIANFAVIIQLTRRSKLTGNDGHVIRKNKSADSTKRISVMLVMVGLSTAVLRLPSVVLILIISNKAYTYNEDFYGQMFDAVTILGAYGLGFLNSCINFFIYVTMSSNFRTQLLALFKCNRRKDAMEKQASKNLGNSDISTTA